MPHDADHDHGGHHHHDHHDHGHHHGHDHHGHSHAPKDFGLSFAVGVGLNTGFVLIEVLVELSTHSLALLADAGHNLSDVMALLMAWGAAVMARRPPAPVAPMACARAPYWPPWPMPSCC